MGYTLGFYTTGMIVYLTLAIRGLMILRNQEGTPQPWEWWGHQIGSLLISTICWPIGAAVTILQVKLQLRRQREAIEALREKPEDEAIAVEREEHMINVHAKRLWVQLVKQGLDHGMPGHHAALQADAGVELFRRFVRTVEGHQQGAGHWELFYAASMDSDEATELVKQFARRFPVRSCADCGQVHD